MPEAPYRVAASCGVAFTALMVAAASIVPTAPEYDSGPAAIRDYLTKHHAALGLSTVLTGAAALCPDGFFGFVSRRLRDGSPGSRSAPRHVSTGRGGRRHIAAVRHDPGSRACPAGHDDGRRLNPATLYAVWLLAFHTAPSMAMIVALVATTIATTPLAPVPVLARRRRDARRRAHTHRQRLRSGHKRNDTGTARADCLRDRQRLDHRHRAHRNPSPHHQPQPSRVPTGRAGCVLTGAAEHCYCHEPRAVSRTGAPAGRAAAQRRHPRAAVPAT